MEHPAGSSDHTATEEPADHVTEPTEQVRTSRPGRFRRGWLAWRRWRRSRPFWGGLLIILGGAEILVTVRAPLPVIIHIGLQGTASYIVPLVIVLCGLLCWFSPAQRVFYALIALILTLASWLTSNLGGFFIGMLQGLIGGSLVLAWTTAAPASRKRSAPAEPEPADDPSFVFPDAAADSPRADQPYPDRPRTERTGC